MYLMLLIVPFFIYILLYLLDRFYKTCAHYPYIQFLKNTGLEIKFLRIKWEITAFNRILLRWGSSHSWLMNSWFRIGLNVTLVFLPIACILLVVSLYQMFFGHSKPNVTSESSIIVPIVPGINLPASDLIYYVLSLAISSIVHELGHALTAVKEDVHLINVGISFFFILPIAYVSLNTEDISKLHPLKSLKILCAGAWHNISLTLLAYLIVVILPYLFTPFYETNTGVIITDLSTNSPLRGNNGLNIGNTVFKINDCKTNNFLDWASCIHKYRSLKPGFCTRSDLISIHDETVFKYSSTKEFNCCNDDRTGSLCFEYLENNNGILEIPPHTCLPVRTVVEHSTSFCNSSSDCQQNTHCLKPMKDNTNVLVINASHRLVVYLGLSDDLYLSVRVSDYIPKYAFLSLNLPNIIEKFFTYVAMISLGLAAVNVVPSLGADGHLISNMLIKLFLGNKIKNEKVYFSVTLLVPFCGTLLLSTFMLHTFWVLIFK